MLNSKEEQNELARKYIEDGNMAARAQLVENNMGLVHSIAKRIYKGIGSIITYEDVLQEGVVGLLVALDNFDLSKDVKFCTYATPWIRTHCNKAVYGNLHAVKMPTTASKKKMIWSGGRIRRELEAKGLEFNLENVSKEVGETEDSLRPVFTLYNNLNRTERFVHVANTEAESIAVNRFNKMYENSSSYESNMNQERQCLYNQCKEIAEEFMQRFDEREQEILSSRVFFFEEPQTLEEIADKYGISNERVRQLQERMETDFFRFAKSRI